MKRREQQRARVEAAMSRREKAEWADRLLAENREHPKKVSTVMLRAVSVRCPECGRAAGRNCRVMHGANRGRDQGPHRGRLVAVGLPARAVVKPLPEHHAYRNGKRKGNDSFVRTLPRTLQRTKPVRSGVVAKFPSRCIACEWPILVGDRMVNRGGWQHAECPPALHMPDD